MRSDDMRPDYIDQARKATIWAAAIAPPPPSDNLTPALRHAFEAPDAVPDDWNRLLARIR